MKTPVTSNLLLEQIVARQAGSAYSAPLLNQGVAFANGFHVYIDLDVRLPLSAAEDDQTASKYLQILAKFAAIGEGAAQLAQAQLLEVQGARLHFLIEDAGAVPSRTAWERLLTLSEAVIMAAYEEIEPMAGKDWHGCRAAADYSPAALLFSTVGGGSLVSLGVAANRPAKRLGQVPQVGAGCLAVPDALAPESLIGAVVRGWREINLREMAAATQPFVRKSLRDSLRRYVRERRAVDFQFGNMDRQFFEQLTSNQQFQPVRVQGFCFRADLDGFTKQVADAFAKGPQAVHELVERFRRLLEFPEHFAQKLNARTILLPWAGDCATVLLLPTYGDSFIQMRANLPVSAAIAWHRAFIAEKRYGEAAGTARWSLGLAAGDGDEGNNGHMVFADLTAAGRRFRIVAGWAAQRSLSAQQYDDVKGGDTVITQVDRKHLWAVHAKAFEDLGSLYARASISALVEQQEERDRRSRITAPVASSVAATIPASRPYYE
jgi:hypothetical protein